MRSLKGSLVLFISLIVLYLIIVFVIPPDQEVLDQFDLNTTQGRILTGGIALPVVIIMSAIYYGYHYSRKYALKIISDQDGKAFNILALGLGVFAFGVPLGAIVDLFINYFSRLNPDFTNVAITINIVISVAVSFGAFILIHQGAKKLTQIAGVTKKWREGGILLSLSILGGILLYETYSSPSGIVEVVDGTEQYTALGVVVSFSRAIIQLVIWYLGLRAAMLISIYKSSVPGAIYGQSLDMYVKGLYTVVFSRIFIEFLTLFFNFDDREFGFILAALYGILALFAIGHIFIAIGANKLNKIEGL